MVSNLKRIYKILKVKRSHRNIIFLKGANIDRNAGFEGQNKIGVESWFEGYIGYGSYIGDHSIVKAKIGRYCSIGHNVTVLTGTHPSHRFVSTHPVFFSTKKQNGITYVNEQKFEEVLYADKENKYGCVIGNDVWIGFGATILGGCKIGDGAIVAANAFVNQDVEPYTIVAGQPAKVISKRFTDEQIDALCQFKWWDKPESWIREHADKFECVDEFIRVISAEGEMA